MTTFRKIVLANEQIYHIYNRGIDHKSVFTTRWEFQRAINTLSFYRFASLPFRFSQLLKLPHDDRIQILDDLKKENNKLVEIICFCLMPNHFHFMLKQLQDGGVRKFISNFTNSYTKYFNTKYERTGHLFEGLFKAVLVETDEQLIHLSRYIHLNPVASFIIKLEDLESYAWSSFLEYLDLTQDQFCQKEIIINQFPTTTSYKKFVYNQVKYSQELEKIKHLLIEK